MTIEPLLIKVPSGPLFAIHHSPVGGVSDRGDFLFVPPFAEEMNLARRMVAVQARWLARAGHGVLLLDLHGTGDSAGDFADARWGGWLGDIAAGLDWLEAQRRPLAGLWGLRLGGMLALEAARANPTRVPRILLWQPTVKGRSLLHSMLRLRVAANMGDNGRRETTAKLRARLAAGETLEIGGYSITPELSAAINEADLAAMQPSAGCTVAWLDLIAAADAPPPRSSTDAIKAWRAAKVEVLYRTVVGEPFWAVQSWKGPVHVPAVWSETVDLLTGRSA